MAVPEGYRRVEGSRPSLVPEARRIGHEDPDAPLSVTIKIREEAGHLARDQVAACARARGLRVDRTMVAEQIVASGTVAQINAAFAIELGIYATGRRSCRGFEGFLHLPEEIADLVAEVTGLIEHGIDADRPQSGPTFPGHPSAGSSEGGSATKVPPRVIAHWTVPHKGPSGPVTPGNY
jgi:pro-kumamolisin-like protein